MSILQIEILLTIQTVGTSAFVENSEPNCFKPTAQHSTDLQFATLAADATGEPQIGHQLHDKQLMSGLKGQFTDSISAQIAVL